MRAVDIVRKKRDGQALSPVEIQAFVRGVTAREWPDYQASALLMAIFHRGMTAEETACLTRAMVHSGEKLDLADLPGPKVDKHSTGGVGDKSSLILAPLAAACGVVVPMMSGRGLGHSGGTLDKLEAIPGFRVGLSLDEFRAALRAVGCALIGQTKEIAPADRLLYALRDVTATVESIPLITASILSKKIAEGIDALVLDVKCGQGAFMKNRADARALAESLVATGEQSGVRTEALLTAMDVPLGNAVGNALEVRESLHTLRGEGPAELESLSVTLAARMLVLGGCGRDTAEAQRTVRAALDSGRGLEKFRDIIAQHGGDPRVVDDPSRLPLAPGQVLLRAPRPGYVADIHAEYVGLATMLLGAGRDRAEDAVDPSVGVVIQAHRGEQVRAGDALAEIHYRAEHRLTEAATLLQRAWRIADAPPPERPLILETVVVSPLASQGGGEKAGDS
jgi:pyrimidine-nucleoside phosphorylase